MKFSIIIPVYNRENYIKKTLESVLNQSYGSLEVICVNDCSVDGSLKILEEYACKDSRIKIISHTENKGPHCARKTGVEHSSGDYILFLDCDDTLTVETCKILHKELLEQSSQILEFSYFCKNKKIISLPAAGITGENLFASLVYFKSPRAGTVWNKAYHAELLKTAFSKMSKFYSVMGEDFYESVITAYYAESYRYINTPLVYYNDETGISNKKKNITGIDKDLKSIKNVLNGFKIFFKEHANEHISALENIEKYYIEYMYYNQILLNTEKNERLPSLKLMEEYFDKRFLRLYLNKSNLNLLLDTVKYKIDKGVKKCIPRKVKTIIKKMVKRK